MADFVLQLKENWHLHYLATKLNQICWNQAKRHWIWVWIFKEYFVPLGFSVTDFWQVWHSGSSLWFSFCLKDPWKFELLSNCILHCRNHCIWSSIYLLLFAPFLSWTDMILPNLNGDKYKNFWLVNLEGLPLSFTHLRWSSLRLPPGWMTSWVCIITTLPCLML